MIEIEHAKKLLEIRGFKVENQEPVLASLMQFLALHPRIFASNNVDLKTMQSVLRENGFRIDDSDPVLLMLALNDIVLTNAKRTAKPEHFEHSTPLVLAGKLAAIGVPLFLAGLLIGSMDRLAFGILAALSVSAGVGLVAGLLITKRVVSSEPEGQPLKFHPQKNDDLSVLTEEKLQSFFYGMSPPISERTQAACRDVLINGNYISSAASKALISVREVVIALEKINKIT